MARRFSKIVFQPICHAVPYHVIPCCVVPYCVVPWHAIPLCVVPCRVVSHRSVLCHSIRREDRPTSLPLSSKCLMHLPPRFEAPPRGWMIWLIKILLKIGSVWHSSKPLWLDIYQRSESNATHFTKYDIKCSHECILIVLSNMWILVKRITDCTFWVSGRLACGLSWLV